MGRAKLAMAVLGSFQYSPVPEGIGVQAVAPIGSIHRPFRQQWKFGRAGALLACCAAAVLVALVGTIDNSETPSAPVLAMKDSLAAVQPDYLQRQNVPTPSNLAASAHTFLDTASGIMQDAKLHANDFQFSSSSSLAKTGREMQLTFAPSHEAPTLTPVLRTEGSKLAEENATTTEGAAKGGEEDATEGEGETATGEKKPKVLGATGKD